MGCDCCVPPKLAPGVASEATPGSFNSLDDAESVIASLDEKESGGEIEAANVKTHSTPSAIEDCCARSNEHCESSGMEQVLEKRGEKLDESACRDACCTNKGEVTDEKCNDPTLKNASAACCDIECDSGCGSPTIDGNVKPPCCEDKSFPCCDNSCLDRIALRECQTKCSTAKSKGITEPDTICCGSTEDKACKQHRRSTRERYGATLEALGCICRALLARGFDSCCESRPRSSIDRRRCFKKSIQSSPRSSVGSCCITSARPTTTYLIKRGIQRAYARGCSTDIREASVAGHVIEVVPAKVSGSSCKDGCYSPKKKPDKEEIGIKGFCSVENRTQEIVSCAEGCCSPAKTPSRKNTCDDDGCAPKQPSHSTTKKLTSKIADLERRLTGNEHVILSISGMTCTGCETKLIRTLATVSAVSNLKTSLILSRAEFDVELGAATAEDIIKHLERTTEFKCEKLTDSGSSIDILAPPGQSSLMNGTWPAGVSEMKLIADGFIRVSFDPTIIGARDLLEKGWDEPQVLAPPRPDPSLEAGSKHVRQLSYVTLLFAVLTIPVLVLAWAPLPKHEALKALIFSRVIEMDLLIVLSTTAAYIFSVIAFGFLMSGRPLEREQFFETSTLLVTLIMVGRYVAALARQKAVESITIRSLQATTATLVDESKGSEREVDARLLQYGDIFKVSPDCKVPTDGTIVAGLSEVDESMLTGESRPVEKCPKSPVIAGSINGSGTLIVRLTRIPGDNTITTIAAMVDEAKLSKPKMQSLADRVASYFVPVVVMLATITFSIWVAVGMAVRHQSGSEAAVKAITYAITVLIVSCPCAIGLAVPMVVVIASGVAAKRGVVFKSADAIEVAYRASHVVFDKTGTLTTGKLSVVESLYPVGESRDSLALLLGLIGSIRHPVSIAVATHLKHQGIKATAVAEPQSLAGRGVEAVLDGKKLRAGNSRWLNLSSHPMVETVLAEGHTAFCFSIDDVLVAVYGLEDSPRPDAGETVSRLQNSGASVHVLSGDDAAAVQKVAAELCIPEEQVRPRCSPSDKQAYIQSLLTTDGPKPPIVIFCGDGTNDAIALAQATIGVHMNSGTDVAKSAADVVLMRPDLSGILTMMSISRRAVHRIKFNFVWSVVYNLVAVLFATGALVTVSLPPEFAGLGELVSVLPVIAAAVLLRWSNV